jgi:hypothetical protein
LELSDDPPPPQPDANAMNAASAKMDVNLATELSELL